MSTEATSPNSPHTSAGPATTTSPRRPPSVPAAAANAHPSSKPARPRPSTKIRLAQTALQDQDGPGRSRGRAHALQAYGPARTPALPGRRINTYLSSTGYDF